MSNWKKIALGAAALVLIALVVGVFLPSHGQVRREIRIDAPAATVFVLLADLKRAREWWPWAEPAADVRIKGPPEDVGTRMTWDSAKFGTGNATIVERMPYAHLALAVEFGNGDRGRSSFDVSRSEDRTRVVWTYDGDFGLNPLARYTGLFLESRRGVALDRGLKALTTLAESLPRVDWSETPIDRLVVEPVDIAFLTATSLPNATAISEAMGDAYFNILAFMDRHGLKEAGAPLSISRRFSGSEFVFDAAIPVQGVTDATPRSENGIRLGKTYGGPVVRGRHIGSYRQLRDTHEKIAAWLAVHGISRNGDAWEVYVSDPTRSPESELITDVYYPIEEPKAASVEVEVGN